MVGKNTQKKAIYMCWLLVAAFSKILQERDWLACKKRQAEIEPRKLMPLGWKSHLDIQAGSDQTMAHNLLQPSCYAKD